MKLARDVELLVWDKPGKCGTAAGFRWWFCGSKHRPGWGSQCHLGPSFRTRSPGLCALHQGPRKRRVMSTGCKLGRKKKKKKKRVHWRTKKKLFPCGDCQAVLLAAHRCFVVSILGCFQSPTGQSPEKPGLSRGLDWWLFKIPSSLDYPVILRFVALAILDILKLLLSSPSLVHLNKRVSSRNDFYPCK